MQTDLRILAGGGVATPLRAIAEHFERVSGYRLLLHFGTTPELIREVTSGAAFDAALTPREVFSDPAARARFAGGRFVEIARVGLGLAVRAGAAKPDISTTGALKDLMLRAQSLATIPASAAGAQIMRLLARLEIADAMADKIKVKRSPPEVVQAVATGETEFGMFLANVFLAPGVELVTPFPTELQQDVTFVAAIAADTPHQTAADTFLAYLQGPEAAALIKSRGMEPA
ncbi:MAG: substrate-binding domain-containing protein [Solirubrobacterales bacterium]|nr:substrate-binding domain-containing protein [Solirubrobacterales bacterium]